MRLRIPLVALGIVAGGLPFLSVPISTPAAAEAPAADGPPVDVRLPDAYEPGTSPPSAVGTTAELPGVEGESYADAAAAIEADVDEAIEALPDVQPGVYSELHHEGDGNFRLIAAGEPIYRPEADGTFTPLDPTVEAEPDADSALGAPDLLAPTTFGGGDAGTVASVDLGDAQVHLTAPDLDIDDPERLGDQQVSFGEVADDAELRYVTSTGAVQELLVLDSLDAPREYRFVLEDPDGVLGAVTQDAEGTWRFSGRGDEPQPLLSLPPAFAYEADPDSLAPRTAPEPGVRTATLDVRPIDGGFEILKRVDDAWFTAEGRQFPIVLDPTIRIVWGRPSQGYGNEPVTDGYVAQQTTCPSPTTCVPFSDFGNLFVGASGSFRAMRSLLAWQYGPAEAHHAFDGENGVPFNLPERAEIDGASLWLKWSGCLNGVTPAESADCGPAPTLNLDVHRVTTDIDPVGVHDAPTWAELDAITSPLPSGSVRNGVTDRAMHPYDFHCELEPNPTTCFLVYGNNEDWQPFYITDIVKQWVDNPSQGAGLVVRARDENRAAPNGTSWWSSLVAPVEQRPYLAADYHESPPGAPAVTANLVGTTINASWAESTTQTWAMRYDAVLVDADTGLVAGAAITRDMTLGHPRTASWSGLATGRYYVAVIPSNNGGAGTAGLSSTLTLGTPGTPGSDGAGYEPWFTFESSPIGPQATAGVNVANGNLVVQQTDATPVQGHGRLGYVVRRTYNSQDGEGAGLLPSGVARGWSLNVSAAGDLGGGVASGLVVPTDLSPLLHPAVTLVDRDGTRHEFEPDENVGTITIGRGNGTSFSLDLSLNGLLRSLLPTDGGPPPLLTNLLSTANEVLESVLEDPLSLAGLAVCIDTTYESPPGVDLALWRFVAIQANQQCSSLETAGIPANQVWVLGYATLRPDRVRQSFAITGQLLSDFDAAGNELRYGYDFELPAGIAFGQPRVVWEPSTCPLGPVLDITCRAIRLNWPTLPGTDLVVTDPGGRQITYDLDAGRRLLNVITRTADGVIVEHWEYGYQGVAGVTCGASPGQLCRVEDPRNNVTSFTYDANGRIATHADRRVAGDPGSPSAAQLTSTFTYGTNETTVVRDGRARRYSSIDPTTLRVGRVRQGTVMQLDANQWVTQSQYDWDAADGVPCTSDGQPGNRLCRRIESAGTLSAGARPPGYVEPVDQVTSWTYGPEGQVLTETAGGLQTQYRYTSSHFYIRPPEQGGGFATTPALLDDFGATAAARPARVVFSVVDRTGVRSPAGRVVSYVVDADYGDPVGTNTGTCGTGNTGLLCTETTTAGPGDNYVSTHTYDTYGQRTTTTAPDGGVTTYTYYADNELDLSSSVRAGGWLRAITDPKGAFVAFGYDRAGNQVRTFDRNATEGRTISQFPGPVGSPPVPSYSETRYNTGTSQDAFANPWRWPRAQRDQLIRTTTLQRDANGNVTEQVTAALRTTRFSYTARDQQATTSKLLLPGDVPTSSNTWTTWYDAHGNAVATIDARGNATRTFYDVANRATQTQVTHGPWADRSPAEELTCQQSTAGELPIAPGRIRCSTFVTYDGLGRAVATTDGAGAVTWIEFDGTGRQVATYAPRSSGTWVESRSLLDGDGNVTTACTPRQELEEGPCTASSHFAKHTQYDGMNRPIVVSTWRQFADPSTGVLGAFVQLQSVTTYDRTPLVPATSEIRRQDAALNTTIERYDTLGRLVEIDAPRLSPTRVVTSQVYDRAGNMLSREVKFAGGAVDTRTVWRYDAAHQLVDVVEGATSLSAAQNSDSFLATATPPQNTRTRFLYDFDGLRVASYDSRAFTASVTDPDERYMTRVDYDGRGRAVAQWQPFYDSAIAPLPVAGGPETTECPATGGSYQPNLVTGAPGFPATTGVCVSRVTYDAVDNIDRVINPTATAAGNSGRYVSYTYTDDNQVRTMERPNPAVTSGSRVVNARYLYDGVSRPVQVTDAANWVVQTAWTADGLVAEEGSRVASAGAFEHRRTFTYNASGQETSATTYLTPALPAGPTETTNKDYYADGLQYQDRTAAVTGQGQLTTRWSYDANGNPSRVWSPSAIAHAANNTAGTPTVNLFTADNLLRSTLDPVDPGGPQRRWTGYGYDSSGRKIAETVTMVNGETQGTLGTPGDGNTLGFTWSQQGWPLVDRGRNTGTAQTITRAYDTAGNLTGIVDNSSGISTINTFYYLNNLVYAVVNNDSTPAASISSNTSTTFRYNGDGLELGRLFDETTATAGYEAYQAYGYNDARALTSVVTSGWADGANVRSWTYTNDVAGRPSTELGPQLNGVSGVGTHMTEWAWHNDGTLTSQILRTGTTPGSGAILDRWDYGYDAYDRITSRTRSGTSGGGFTQPYGYDAAGRLTSWSTTTYTYDQSSNRLSSVSPAGTINFAYRADNSLRSINNAPNYQQETFGGARSDGTANYTYDGFGRVLTTNKSGTITTERHDGLGRIRSTVGGDTRLQLYVGLTSTVSHDYIPSTNPFAVLRSSRYVTGPGGDTLASYDLYPSASAMMHTLHTDGFGNTVMLDDLQSATSTVQCRISYDPWGVAQTGATGEPCTDPSTANSIWYRGTRRTQGSGTYTFGARTYNPTTATWLTPDRGAKSGAPTDLSVGTDPLTANRYSYVNGDPINFVDPSGHVKLPPAGVDLVEELNQRLTVFTVPAPAWAGDDVTYDFSLYDVLHAPTAPALCERVGRNGGYSQACRSSFESLVRRMFPGLGFEIFGPACGPVCGGGIGGFGIPTGVSMATADLIWGFIETSAVGECLGAIFGDNSAGDCLGAAGREIVITAASFGVARLVRAIRAGRSLREVEAIAEVLEADLADSVATTRQLPFRDADRVTEILNVLDNVDSGGPFPFKQDGTVFRNNEGLLPAQPAGYYHEYTVPTPGATNRGTRRLVVGESGEVFYTDDHYQSFVQISGLSGP